MAPRREFLHHGLCFSTLGALSVPLIICANANNGKETAPIDPQLLDALWGTRAFVARYGIEQPLEILSGDRSAKSNIGLIEQGIPAARQSLHIDGKAADIRIANLNSEVLGSLVRVRKAAGSTPTPASSAPASRAGRLDKTSPVPNCLICVLPRGGARRPCMIGAAAIGKRRK